MFVFVGILFCFGFFMISRLEERKDRTGFRVVFIAVFSCHVDVNKNRIARLKILAVAS